jgi:hypothetical protein
MFDDLFNHQIKFVNFDIFLEGENEEFTHVNRLSSFYLPPEIAIGPQLKNILSIWQIWYA